MKTIAEQIKELQAKLASIESYCAGWKSCNDGSYEMALHNSGYDTVWEELRKLYAESTK